MAGADNVFTQSEKTEGRINRPKPYKKQYQEVAPPNMVPCSRAFIGAFRQLSLHKRFSQPTELRNPKHDTWDIQYL